MGLLSARLVDAQGQRVQVRRYRLTDREDWEQIGLTMLSRVRQRTSAGEGPDGPLASYSAATTARTGQTGPATLRRTGALLGSLEAVAGRRDATVRTTIPYARFVAEGTKRQPARPFLGFDETLVEQVVDQTRVLIRRRIQGASKARGALAASPSAPAIGSGPGVAL